jgi:hypothetical protein
MKVELNRNEVKNIIQGLNEYIWMINDPDEKAVQKTKELKVLKKKLKKYI